VNVAHVFAHALLLTANTYTLSHVIGVHETYADQFNVAHEIFVPVKVIETPVV